ncbi:hypothetical protein AAMO2058_000500700 [Amorphochlora amoebiformis]
MVRFHDVHIKVEGNPTGIGQHQTTTKIANTNIGNYICIYIYVYIYIYISSHLIIFRGGFVLEYGHPAPTTTAKTTPQTEKRLRRSVGLSWFAQMGLGCISTKIKLGWFTAWVTVAVV